MPLWAGAGNEKVVLLIMHDQKENEISVEFSIPGRTGSEIGLETILFAKEQKFISEVDVPSLKKEFTSNIDAQEFPEFTSALVLRRQLIFDYCRPLLCGSFGDLLSKRKAIYNAMQQRIFSDIYHPKFNPGA